VDPEPAHAESIWARLKRHKVVEWTLAYVAFGYALLHGVQMLREAFDWPFLVYRLTAVGLVLGTPVAVTLAWFHGYRARHRVSGQELSILIALLVVAGSALWWVSRHSHERAMAPVTTATSAASLALAFNPPPHSIAVLPFVNMSGDKEQEYFSEGLTEELLNSLSRITELQVAARTSSFSFQGEHPDIATVAHRLNVGAILEGSVRRSAHTVRITAQLVNGVTGFHLWSQTYDRDLGDVLALQTEIANAVAGALKVSLLGSEDAKIEAGGTRNPAAFDAYLRASKAYWDIRNAKDAQVAIDRYTEAIRLDPIYSLGYAARSIALSNFADQWATTVPAMHAALDRAQADARKSIDLASGLGDGHLALAISDEASLEFMRASQEYESAFRLAPGSARILWNHGNFAVLMGRSDYGLTSLRRAVTLDPLNPVTHGRLGIALRTLRRYEEAMAAFRDVQTTAPSDTRLNPDLGMTYYLLGDFENARSSCEKAAEENDYAQLCMAMTYEKLGRHADAETMLAKMRASDGDTVGVFYAYIYAQWGDTSRALDGLQLAMSVKDPWLENVRTSPFLDPLRNEPRFQAIERELKFPE
jgi:serine/threonine-protein kinase